MERGCVVATSFLAVMTYKSLAELIYILITSEYSKQIAIIASEVKEIDELSKAILEYSQDVRLPTFHHRSLMKFPNGATIRFYNGQAPNSLRGFMSDTSLMLNVANWQDERTIPYTYFGTRLGKRVAMAVNVG